MPTYTAHFNTDANYAICEIKAKSPAAALARAKRMIRDSDAHLYFQGYAEASPVNEIVIFDDAENDVATWLDPDLQLRLNLPHLLVAAREVIARWEHGDLAEAVRNLAAAVAGAEGRAP